jgi:hypothetical protein
MQIDGHYQNNIPFCIKYLYNLTNKQLIADIQYFTNYYLMYKPVSFNQQIAMPGLRSHVYMQHRHLKISLSIIIPVETDSTAWLQEAQL